MKYRRKDRVTLWHPDSPGVKLSVRPSWLRCLGVSRSDFASLGESIHATRKLPDPYVSGLPWLVQVPTPELTITEWP